MTFEILEKIIAANNIPRDVRLISDSGWELGATEMNGAFYNEAENTIVFTQSGTQLEKYYTEDGTPEKWLRNREKGWKKIYGEGTGSSPLLRK